MRARTARIGDAAAVHRIIAHYAGEGLLLPRTEAEIREHVARFLVLVEKRDGQERVLGCVALEPYGSDLAEVRSLAVAPDARGQGRNVGDRLMKAAMDTARRRKQRLSTQLSAAFLKPASRPSGKPSRTKTRRPTRSCSLKILSRSKMMARGCARRELRSRKSIDPSSANIICLG